MESSEALGNRLRGAREHARMTQAEAAAALGVSQAALSQYEAGKRRVDALTLDHLGRLYGVPLSFFFGHRAGRPDWEDALRSRAEGVSPAGKAGIGQLIAHLRDLEELRQRTGTPVPGIPYPPFAPLPEEESAVEHAAIWAEKARRYYDLGVAPLPDLRSFLEAQGYLTFAVPLGIEPGDLSGLCFRHPELGPIVALNADQSYTRRPFTMAHELAHGLYHYDRPAILCRSGDQRPLERFADRFASFFLIPPEALRDRLRGATNRTVRHPEQIVHLARYFGVSYRAMCHRLGEERLLDRQVGVGAVQPMALARSLGYRPSPFECGRRPLPPEERLPRVFLELGHRAIRDGRLSPRRVAEMMGISALELEERLAPAEVEEEGFVAACA